MQSFSNLRKSALDAYIVSKKHRRRIAIRRAGLISFVVLFGVSIVIVAAVVYSSNKVVLPGIFNPGLLGPFASLLPSTPAGFSDPESSAPAGLPDTSQAAALPSPLPSATPTLAPTATPYLPDTPTHTPTVTSTPTVTFTPSQTLTPSPTVTPSETPIGGPLPTSTSTPSPEPTEINFPGCHPSGNSSFESSLLALINSERESKGLLAYEQQSQLGVAAQVHSTDMACNRFFSHSGSDGSSKEERVAEQGYSGALVGENIYASGDSSSNVPQLAFEFWMASPPNRANILHDEFTEIGIGYIYEPSSPFGGYFTVVFARPY